MSDYSNWDYDRDIICPYCGKSYTPEYELWIGDSRIDVYEDGKEQECTCEECGKRFRVTPEMQWYYTTETISGEMTEEEHEAMELSEWEKGGEE